MKTEQKPTLLVITGPTAVGKTEFTVNTAERLNTEIISCDSRQFYRELNAGTAKPTPKEQKGIPHHFINDLSLPDFRSAGDYETEAVNRIKKLFKKHNTLILTGGSGLYLNAVLFGLDEFPDIPEKVEDSILKLYDQGGLSALQEEVKKRDPEFYQTADIKNPRRLMRALQVCITADRPYSEFRSQQPKKRPWDHKIFVLNRPRQELYERINLRTEHMIENGLVNEAEELSRFRDHKALQTVGYRELFPYFNGEYSLERAVELIKRNTRRYAKRQLTWFNKLPDAQFIRPPFNEVERFIADDLNPSH